MKNIKLAVIRGSHSEVCPFGLDIPNGCKNAGASIKDMLPTNDKMTDEEFQKTVDENIKVFNEKHDKTTCEHLTSILDKFDSVDCNFGDGEGPGLNVAINNEPVNLFYGSLNGIDTYPAGTLSEDYDITRNMYNGISFNGYTNASSTNNNALLKGVANLSEENMELVSKAQMADILVEEMPSHDDEKVVMYSDKPSEDLVLEMHVPEEMHEERPGHLDIVMDIDFNLPNIPGAPLETQDEVIEVKEEDVSSDKSSDKSSKDENQAKVDVKKSKWDWESKGAHGFVAWVKERLEDVPKHSGKDVAGIDRAIAYLEKLDAEISKAMRSDLDGDLDADKVEEVRLKIEDGIDRLGDRIDSLKKVKKVRKKTSEVINGELLKSAQRTPSIKGIVVTVPLLISHVARVIINGMVSGGHDAEDMFSKLSKKYKLTDREKVEVVQLLEDMGMPIRRDRGLTPDELLDTTSSDNFDLNSNFPS